MDDVSKEALMGPEFLPSETLSLARAIVQRNQYEQAIFQQATGEFIPQTEIVVKEVRDSMQVGATVAMLNLLEQPDAEIKPEEILDVVLDRNTVKMLWMSKGEESDEDELTIERNELIGALKAILDIAIRDEDVYAKFERQVKTAQRLAKEYNVDVSDIFTDEEYYIALTRSIYTPQSFIVEQLQAFANIENNLPELLSAVIIGAEETELKREFEQGIITEDEYKIKLFELHTEVLDILGDEESVAELKNIIDLSRMAFNKSLVDQLVRFWGVNVLDELDEATRAQLLETPDTNASLMPFISKEFDRSNLIAKICAENGWDRERLTIEQAAYINTSPEMRAIEYGSEF